MSEALGQVLAALTKLGGADRAAILRRLSPDERSALAKLRAVDAKPMASSPKMPAPVCSAWLAKRLAQILEDRDDSITPAARAALRSLLSGAEP